MKRCRTFGDLEKSFTDLDKSKIAILPVPYDETSTWMKGADKAPCAIIEASAAMELYDIETHSEVYKRGIHTSPPLECRRHPEEMVREVDEKVRELIEAGKFVVVLGGEHSVTIGALKAHANAFKNLSVLQLDAHLDMRDEYEGSRYNHACVMARAREICPAVQVGIRSMSAEEKDKAPREDIFFAADIAGKNDWQARAVERLSRDVYISIDLDVFDPSVMPSTGTPEPGGLGWYEVVRFLRRVSEERRVAGFDIVELCPNVSDKAPDFTAAKLVYKLLSYVFIHAPEGHARKGVDESPSVQGSA